MDFTVKNVGSKVEEENFYLLRPQGLVTKYDFIHFLTEIKITIEGTEKTYSPGVCILYTPDFAQNYSHVNGWINHDWIEFECNDISIIKNLKIPLNTPFYTTISKAISDQIKQLSNTFKIETIFTNIESSIQLVSLFLLISKHLHSRSTNAYSIAKKERRDFLSNIRLEMYQNPCGLNAKEIAKKNGYSPTHFCEVYKKTFQVNIHNDLSKAKLEYVIQKIKEGQNNRDIAENLKFSSVEYLYMWFKKQTGKTINQYKKEHSL